MTALRYEVLSPPGVGTPTVRIADAQPTLGSYTAYRRQTARGQMGLPAGYSRLAEIVDTDPDDHSNDVASLVRVWRPAQGSYPETLMGEWLPRRTPDQLAEDQITVSGDGMQSTLDWVQVEPWDWDGTAGFVSTQPDWVYGGRNVLVDFSDVDPQCEPRISEFWTDATSGQWRVTVNGDVVDIDFDATASEVTTAYESLASVNDVLVEGNGSEDTPWRVTFVDPCFPTTYSAVTHTLDEPLNAGLIEQGRFMPAGWTEARPLDKQTLYGDYNFFGYSTLPAATPAGSTEGIEVDANTPVGFSFPGAQTVTGVTPDFTYQGGVWVYVDAAGTFEMRLVLRAPTEEPLIASSGFPSVDVPGQTWTLLDFEDVQNLSWVERAIFRVSYVGSANPPTFYVADPFLTEGMAPATVGQIMLELLVDAQSDHAGRSAIPFITADFDATLDSSGNAWPGDESVDIQRGQTYRRVLDQVFGKLGYEWDLAPDVGAGTWDLQIWGPDMRGTDYSAADTPSLLLGQGTRRGSAFTELPRGNALTVEGAGQRFFHDENTGSITAIGRREAYRGDVSYQGELSDWASETLERFMDESFAPSFDVHDGPDWPVPGVAYGLADNLTVDIGTRRVARQVESHGFTDTDSDGVVWTVQFGQATFGTSGSGSPIVPSGGSGRGEAGWYPLAEATRRLIERIDRLPRREGATAFSPSGGGGMAHILIVSDSEPSEVQAKADYVVPSENSASALQRVFDQVPNGSWSIWMAGVFDLESDVTVPSGSWLRGLGYTQISCP